MNWIDLALYLLIYSFLGWCAEVLYYAVTKRRFCNRGFLTLPFLLSYGGAFDLLILTLPALAGRYALQFLFTMAIVSVVESFSNHLNGWLGPKVDWGAQRSRALGGSLSGLIFSAIVAALFYITYLVVHPLLLGLMTLVPAVLKQITVWGLFALMAADFWGVLYTLRTGGAQAYALREAQSSEGQIASRLTAAVWRRLQKAYTGIRELSPE